MTRLARPIRVRCSSRSLQRGSTLVHGWRDLATTESERLGLNTGSMSKPISDRKQTAADRAVEVTR